MYEKIKVRGVKYPVGHKNYPIHSSMPGGPLVRVPDSPPQYQQYIGWHKVQIAPTERDHPTKPGTKQTVIKADPMPDGKARMKRGEPVTYRWEYDPTPIEVFLTSANKYIKDAIEDGDLEIVTETPKRAKSGGES